MMAANVPRPPVDAPHFRRRLPPVRQAQLLQTWMNQRLAGLNAHDFGEARLVVASIQEVDSPPEFGDVWRKIEQVDFGCGAPVVIFIDLQSDEELLKFTKQIGAFESSHQIAIPQVVLVHHSTALSQTVDVDRVLLAALINRGIEIIPTGPKGLQLVLSVRAKFMRVRSECKKRILSGRLIEEARRLQNAIHDAVWDYLRQRLETGIPPVSPDIPAGIPTQIGDAALDKLLGKGSWGKVFELKDPNAEASVLKCIPKASHTSLQGIKALRNEISVMKWISSASLQHPNIVKLYQVHSSSSHVFLRLEHGGPETLATRLKRRDTDVIRHHMSFFDAVSSLSQCADALYHLHSKAKVAHRDLKTENIIYSGTEYGGNIKISDFGLASVFEKQTTGYGPCGSFFFLAPEVVLEECYNVYAADIWSMGIIFLEVLCFLYFPDNVLFRRYRDVPKKQAMEEVHSRLRKPESVQSMILTYLKPDYRVDGIRKVSVLNGMLNVVASDRSEAEDVSRSCASWLAQVKAIRHRGDSKVAR